jgi:pyruvate/2-oxoglutarate dehydrogenase complex dihydrolipoamide dehydrogenase (E3) component
MSEHYQVIVIGSGSGGKDAANLNARAGLRVLLQKVSVRLVLPAAKEAGITFVNTHLLFAFYA